MKSIRSLLLVGTLLIVLTIAGALYTLRPRTETVPEATQTEIQDPPTVSGLLKLVNEQRSKVGVAPLTLDERLNWSAQQKADDMATYHYFGHLSDKSANDRGDARQWLQKSGVQCVDSSENIEVNATVPGFNEQKALDGGSYQMPVDPTPHMNTSESSVHSWVQSPPHYKAMVNSKYTTTGFGINGVYVVEHFCQVS